jgi:hypothetical protein
MKGNTNAARATRISPTAIPVTGWAAISADKYRLSSPYSGNVKFYFYIITQKSPVNHPGDLKDVNRTKRAVSCTAPLTLTTTEQKGQVLVYCTPKVRQYDMLEITLGVFLCQKENHFPGS